MNESLIKLDTIGKRLKYIRNFEGYSQLDFSQLLGVPFSTYKTYELDKANTPHTLLQNINEKFPSVSIEWLVSGKESNLSTNHILSNYVEFKYKKKLNLNDITLRLFEKFWNDYYVVEDDVIQNFYDVEDYNTIISKNDLVKMGDFISLICDFNYTYFLEKDLVPLKEFFNFPAMHNLKIEWVLYGTDYIEEEKSSSELISLLKYASPYFIEQLKEKLKEMKKIQSISL